MGRSPLVLLLLAAVLLAGGYVLGRASAPESTPDQHPWIVHEPHTPEEDARPSGPLLHPAARPPPKPKEPTPAPPPPVPEPVGVAGAGEGAQVHVKGGMLKVVLTKGQYVLVKEGPWIEYHENGNRAGEGAYVNGSRHGDWMTWYGDGSLHTKATYDHGKTVGPYQMFHPNGQMSSESLFRKGVRHGLFRQWRPDGAPALESNFEYGKAHGEVRLWHANGQLAERGMRERGMKQGVWSTWDENGVLRTETTWVDGRVDGPVRVYDEDGNRMTLEAAEIRATVKGKYSRLLKRVPAPQDRATYGHFKDFGHYGATSYAGVNDIPAGYWVYVFPDWFIWGDVTQSQK